jgi:hypothetical protein
MGIIRNIQNREIGDFAPAMQSNGDFTPFFQLCDFTSPFRRRRLCLPLFITLLTDEQLEKIKK